MLCCKSLISFLFLFLVYCKWLFSAWLFILLVSLEEGGINGFLENSAISFLTLVWAKGFLKIASCLQNLAEDCICCWLRGFCGCSMASWRWRAVLVATAPVAPDGSGSSGQGWLWTRSEWRLLVVIDTGHCLWGCVPQLGSARSRCSAKTKARRESQVYVLGYSRRLRCCLPTRLQLLPPPPFENERRCTDLLLSFWLCSCRKSCLGRRVWVSIGGNSERKVSPDGAQLGEGWAGSLWHNSLGTVAERGRDRRSPQRYRTGIRRQGERPPLRSQRPAFPAQSTDTAVAIMARSSGFISSSPVSHQ